MVIKKGSSLKPNRGENWAGTSPNQINWLYYLYCPLEPENRILALSLLSLGNN